MVKPRAKAKLKTEIEIHKRLRHPNVVQFYDAWEDEQNVYMILELCTGSNLADIVKKKGR